MKISSFLFALEKPETGVLPVVVKTSPFAGHAVPSAS
jgi:hypothetical protein